MSEGCTHSSDMAARLDRAEKGMTMTDTTHQCVCCKRDKPDVTRARNGRPTQALCDACWNDPALEYIACKHGIEGER